VTLPQRQSVWHQPNGAASVLPFHPTAPDLGLQFLRTSRTTGRPRTAWNGGNYDQWVAAKGTTTMAYLTRDDIPFHYALADAFTICDAYHCSLLGPTDPNRYYMWTGWVGNDGKRRRPGHRQRRGRLRLVDLSRALQAAGVSWKIYQDVGTGLDAAGFWGWTDDPYIGNYGDNSLLYFHQYQNALPGSPLYEKARAPAPTSRPAARRPSSTSSRPTSPSAGTLPQVSWIVAPEAFSEHPNWPANYGAWYVVAGAGRADLQPGGVEQDRAVHHLRRERRLLRPRRAALCAASAAQGLSTVPTDQRDLRRQRDVPGRPVRPRPARADDRGLAVEQGRLGLLGGVRPHLDHPLHRAALRQGGHSTFRLRPGGTFEHTVQTNRANGWYDVSVTIGSDAGYLRRFAGHVETGRHSTSDPATHTS
jgi:phospholipase C